VKIVNDPFAREKVTFDTGVEEAELCNMRDASLLRDGLGDAPRPELDGVGRLISVLDRYELRALGANGSTVRVSAYGAAQESNLPSVGLPRLTGFEDRLGHRAPPLRRLG
jgi:hypothetical protein